MKKVPGWRCCRAESPDSAHTFMPKLPKNINNQSKSETSDRHQWAELQIPPSIKTSGNNQKTNITKKP